MYIFVKSQNVLFLEEAPSCCCRGSHHATTIEKKATLSGQQSKLLEDMFAKLKWGFKWKKGDEKQILEGNSLPASVMKLLTQAHDTEHKLAQDAMKLMKKIPENTDSSFKALKKEYSSTVQFQQDLKHVMDFKELPVGTFGTLTKSSFDLLMGKVTCFDVQLRSAVKTQGNPKLKNTFMFSFLV